MRPSPLLIGLILFITAMTVVASVWWPGLDAPLIGLWGGFAILVACDLALSAYSNRLEIAFDLPKHGFVGQTVPFSIELWQRRGALPAKIDARLDFAPGLLAGDIPPLYRLEKNDGTLKASIDIKLTRRGEFSINMIWLMWPSRLRLLEVIVQAPVGREITVLPDISPVLSGAIKAQILPLDAGQKDMRLRGQGSEFHQLREFVPGMDPRSLDWKRSARMRSLVVREMTSERNQQIILCVDSGRLMAEEIAGLTKLDRAINAALAMCWAAGNAGDLVGFYNFDNRPRLFIPPSPGRAAFSRLQTACATLRYEVQETNHTLGLTHLAGQLKRRSLIVVFSDFIDSTTAALMMETMQTLVRHHFIVFVAMSDSAVTKFIEPEVMNLDTVAQSVAARQIRQERRTVLETLGRLGVLCLDSTPETLTSDLVARYIEIKSRELI